MSSKEPIMQVLSASIEAAINKAFEWSNNGAELLLPLMGKTCIIHVQELNYALLFSVADHTIVVRVDEDQQYLFNPDENSQAQLGSNECWLSVSIFALEQLKQKNQLSKLIKTGQLDFAGDLSILQNMSHVFANIELDLEEVLSKYVGDVAAYQINSNGKKLSEHIKKQVEVFSQTFADAALDEKPIAVRKIMMVNFCDEVSQLEADLKRIEARINTLFAKMENNK